MTPPKKKTKKKNRKQCKEKNALKLQLIVVIKGAPEATPVSAPKVSLSDLHKDVQEGVFEVAPKILL